MIKAKTLFTLIVGGAILFYSPFLQELLFNIGPAKVYAQDFVTLFFVVYLLFVFIFQTKKKRLKLKSTKFFILFFIWGFVAILRGFMSYGFHTIGEARWYVFVLLYYFFILLVFKQRRDVAYFLKRIGFFIIAMIVIHFIQFYFLGMVAEKTGRSAFRFINATEALLVSFMLIWFFFTYINKYNRISKINLYILLGIYSIIIVVVQIRSVWLATVGGVLAALFFSKKISFIRSLEVTAFAFILFFATIPMITNFVGTNASSSIEKSSIFLKNPYEDADSQWRLIGWAQELEKFKNNPIIGEGLGGYSEWYVNGQWLRVAIHNGYIMDLAKFGIIGFILLFIGIYYWFKEMNRFVKNEKDKYFKLLGGGLEIALFMHLIFVTFYGFTMFFWIILGLGSSLIIISGENNGKRKMISRLSSQKVKVLDYE